MDNSLIKEIGHYTGNGDGKKYIVINRRAWYPAEKWTEEQAKDDYVIGHANGGFGVLPKWVWDN